MTSDDDWPVRRRPYKMMLGSGGHHHVVIDADGKTVAQGREETCNMAMHDVFKTGDPRAPDAIKDANGEVVLGLCKVCGRGERELIEPCKPKKPTPDPEDDYADRAEWKSRR